MWLERGGQRISTLDLFDGRSFSSSILLAHPSKRRRPQHSLHRPTCPFPRFPPLEVFGRRPL